MIQNAADAAAQRPRTCEAYALLSTSDVDDEEAPARSYILILMYATLQLKLFFLELL